MAINSGKVGCWVRHTEFGGLGIVGYRARFSDLGVGANCRVCG